MLRIGVAALVAAGVLWVAPRGAEAALGFVHDDQVHYSGHLLAGRILSLCPLTARLAEVQYAKGAYHARTPRQLALLTTERPGSLGARVAEGPRLAAGALRHISARLRA